MYISKIVTCHGSSFTVGESIDGAVIETIHFESLGVNYTPRFVVTLDNENTVTVFMHSVSEVWNSPDPQPDPQPEPEQPEGETDSGLEPEEPEQGES